jgi:hypothetical protein
MYAVDQNFKHPRSLNSLNVIIDVLRHHVYCASSYDLKNLCYSPNIFGRLTAV